MDPQLLEEVDGQPPGGLGHRDTRQHPAPGPGFCQALLTRQSSGPPQGSLRPHGEPAAGAAFSVYFTDEKEDSCDVTWLQ